MRRALNAWLPEDVAVRECAEVTATSMSAAMPCGVTIAT